MGRELLNHDVGGLIVHARAIVAQNAHAIKLAALVSFRVEDMDFVDVHRQKAFALTRPSVLLRLFELSHCLHHSIQQ